MTSYYQVVIICWKRRIESSLCIPHRINVHLISYVSILTFYVGQAALFLANQYAISEALYSVVWFAFHWGPCSGLSQGSQASDILAGCCRVQMGYGTFAAPLGHSQLLGSRWDLFRSVIRKVLVEGFCRGFLFLRVIEKGPAPFLSPCEFPSLLSP